MRWLASIAALAAPVKSAAEFVALAKTKPGKLNYGSGGVGSLAHLWAEAFRFATGIDYVHVPFKGAPGIIRGLMGEAPKARRSATRWAATARRSSSARRPISPLPCTRRSPRPRLW